MAPILRVVSSEISPRVMIEFLYSIQRGGLSSVFLKRKTRPCVGR
jgi:hypothetical protein